MPTANPSLRPTKKRKVSAKKHGSLAHIQRLERLLLDAVSEGTSLNPLVDLLDAAAIAEDPHLLFKSIYSLYRVFASIIDTGMLVPTPDSDAKAVRTWVWEKLNTFTDMLVGLMSDSENSLRVSVSQCSRLRYKPSSPDLCNTNTLLPPQAPIIFSVPLPGRSRTFYFV